MPQRPDLVLVNPPAPAGPCPQVGVSAAARIKKSCLVLCTNGVSVDQWKYQFEMWTNIQVGVGVRCLFASLICLPACLRVPCIPAHQLSFQLIIQPPISARLPAHLAVPPALPLPLVCPHCLPVPPLQKNQVCRFTSQTREWFDSPAGVCITTYTMVAFTGRRSAEGERIMSQLMSREWGLILLDEVRAPVFLAFFPAFCLAVSVGRVLAVGRAQRHEPAVCCRDWGLTLLNEMHFKGGGGGGGVRRKADDCTLSHCLALLHSCLLACFTALAS